MIWGGMSGYYRTDLVIKGSLTEAFYRDLSIAPHVQPFMTAHQHVEMFQQDNTHPHTVQVCTAFLQTAEIQVMDWPAKSPDLSSIGTLWATLGDIINQMPHQPTTVAGLTAALQQE